VSETPIAVLGAGSWGTALAIAIANRPGNRVVLWGRDPRQMETIRRRRENAAFLPGIRLPETIRPSADLAEAAGAEAILMVVPSGGLRETAEQLAAIGTGATLISCTKGIERGSGLRMSEILARIVPGSPVAVLSGPSHAEEVARGMPTALVLGCAREAVAARWQAAITSPTFRVYTSTDVPGIELGGALKNVFAIAAGLGDGLGFGDNTKAALVTRALGELIRVGMAMGGRSETFHGLSGVGDLMVTCFSRHSRNRKVGEALGRGDRSLEAIMESMTMVAEGVPTTLAAWECARQHGLTTPVIDAVHALLYLGKTPQEILEEVLTREPKPEIG